MCRVPIAVYSDLVLGKVYAVLLAVDNCSHSRQVIHTEKHIIVRNWCYYHFHISDLHLSYLNIQNRAVVDCDPLTTILRFTGFFHGLQDMLFVVTKRLLRRVPPIIPVSARALAGLPFTMIVNSGAWKRFFRSLVVPQWS